MIYCPISSTTGTKLDFLMARFRNDVPGCTWTCFEANFNNMVAQFTAGIRVSLVQPVEEYIWWCFV